MSKVTYSLPELFFFYDPLQKQVIFSSASTKNIQTIPIEIRENISWTGVPDEDIEDVKAAWEQCMQLKSQESKEFLIRTGRGYGYDIFRVVATGVEMDNRLLLHCHIHRQYESDKLEKVHNEFVDIAAHDLDAPLRKLSVLVETLVEKRDQGKETDVAPYVTRINKCIGDMRSLVDNLANLSRAGMPVPASNVTTFNLGELVSEVVKDMDSMISEKNATIKLETLPEISGNRSQFRILLTNIIDNAIRFTRPGETPQVEISSASVSDEEKKQHALAVEKNYIKIKITDTGIGIIPKDREIIFRPFVRLNGKSEFAGNGIGLAISKKIIENHGGVLFADQHTGPGSCFILIIPQTII